MPLLKPKALFPEHVIADPAADFRTARRIERYRVSDSAVYIPAGFIWQYFPLSAVTRASRARRRVESETSMTGWSDEYPAIAVFFGERKHYLEMDKDGPTDTLLALLNAAAGV